MSSSNLWILKYRPNTLAELLNREDFKNTIKSFKKSDNMPHIMISGPKGYGKMTAAILAAKEILGDSFETNFKIVYAKDPLTTEERDMVKKGSYVSTTKLGSSAGRTFSWPAFIYSRIKPFVELRPIGEKKFKILIIRDFHVLTNEQQGFRRLMEKYSSTCRMILLTDEISSVIDPILSRCMIFFFKKIEFSDFSQIISKVINNENLKCKGNIPKMLYMATEGRIGDAINILQKASISGDIITADTIFNSINDSFTLEMDILIRAIFANNIERAQKVANKLNKLGYEYNDILVGIVESLFKLPIDEKIKTGLISIISDYEFNTLDGNDFDIKINNFIYNFSKVFTEINKVGL